MSNAPFEIWAFHDESLAEDNLGATIIAHDTVQRYGHRYVRTGQADKIRYYLNRMDDELLARGGSAELTHDEAKEALRDVYLLSCGADPEFHPSRIIGATV